jgi:hypothetical protein
MRTVFAPGGCFTRRVVVTCAAVPFADHDRFFTQPVGSTEAPQPVGSNGEPVFVIEGLAAGTAWECLSRR